MAYLSDKIKVELVLPEGTHVATLANSSLKWKKETDRDYGFTIRKISEVIFFNDSQKSFNKLKPYIDSQDSCTQILMKLYTKDHDGTEVLRQTYELPVRAGNHDDDNCTLEIEPRLIHGLKCLLDTAKVEHDLLLDITEGRRTLRFIDANAEVQFRVCRTNTGYHTFHEFDLPTTECEPSMITKGWTIVRKLVNGATEEDIVDTSDGRRRMYKSLGFVTTHYARQFVAGTAQPQGGGWVQVDDGWAKAVGVLSGGVDIGVDLEAEQDAYYEDYESQERTFFFEENFEIIGYDTQGNLIEIDNGLPLQDVLEVYANACGLTVVSDFFGINPDNTAPNNKAYDYAAAYLQDLVIYQASDVINASADINATILKMSFEKLFANLLKYNVAIISSSTNVLRIEHVSYRARRRHLNLLSNYKLIKGKRKYGYDKSESPRFERFTEKYETGSEDFDNNYIEYDALCSDDSKNNEKPYAAPNTVSNIGYLYNNADLIEDLDKQKDTIVIAAIVDGAIALSFGPLSGQSLINGPLAWSNVLPNLWLWDRPQKMGRINGTSAEFESIVPTRKQEKMTVRVCQNDFWDEFSEDDLVKAHYGWSHVDDSEYTLPEEHLEVTLKF